MVAKTQSSIEFRNSVFSTDTFFFVVFKLFSEKNKKNNKKKLDKHNETRHHS